MTIKKNVAPVSVVRAFLEDGQIWQTVYCEDEEFDRDGERFTDLKGLVDSDLVSVVGGHVYKRGSAQDYVGSLADFFNQYRCRSVDIVVVQVEPARREALLALLELHGYPSVVVERTAD